MFCDRQPSVDIFKTYYGRISYCCLGGEFPDGGGDYDWFTWLFRNEHLETQVELTPLGPSFSLNECHSINLIIRHRETEGLIESYYGIIIISNSQVLTFVKRPVRVQRHAERPAAPLSCPLLTYRQVFKMNKLGYFLNDLICILLSTVSSVCSHCWSFRIQSPAGFHVSRVIRY